MRTPCIQIGRRVRLAALITFVIGASTVLDAQSLPTTFTKLRLTANYYAEGANAGDFNNDGVMDVVAGPFWWAGPDYGTRHTIYSPRTFPINSYADNFFAHCVDLNGDGWDDLLTIGFPGQAAHWYENPKSTSTLWAKHLVHATIDGEAPVFEELVVGGIPEIVCATGGRMGYLTPVATPTAPWTFHPISAPGPWSAFTHGLGVGDVNRDGRADILTNRGWFEQPPSLVGDPVWQEHLFAFAGVGGAQMIAYDVDGDLDNDVITSINAHGWGLSWFEHQVVNNAITFQDRVILPKTRQPPPAVQFSQLHAMDTGDIDGDGLDDIVTGKTFWAHNGLDPGATDPAVVYWFRLTRAGNTVTYTPHLVDNDSGVGRQVVVRDMNKDGRPDIVTGNKKGVFVFSQDTLRADITQISLQQPARQTLTLDAGARHAGKPYAMFGSITGESPGVNVAGLHVPLNADAYTQVAIGLSNSSILPGFLGTLDNQGKATASVALPTGLGSLAGLTLHHAFVAFDQGKLSIASNATPLRLAP